MSSPTKNEVILAATFHKQYVSPLYPIYVSAKNTFL